MTQKYPIAPQNTGEVIIYQTADGQTSIDVKMENETVWLTQQQMSLLFQKDRTVIGRHINNIFKEGELDPNVVCAKFAHTTQYMPTVAKIATVQNRVSFHQPVHFLHKCTNNTQKMRVAPSPS